MILLAGLWAVIATIFVVRSSCQQSVAAGGVAADGHLGELRFVPGVSGLLPSSALALAALIGASALAVILLGRPADAITAGITTAVIMVAAAVSPQHAWQQPILRLADTIGEAAVGVAAAWADTRVIRLRLRSGTPAG